MNEHKKENRVRVFVYGTLKQERGNHEWYLADNDGVEYLGRCLISGDYRMYSNGAIPMVTKGDDPTRVAHILGECYEVDENTLDALDCLEGHPDWYKRERVDTPWKKAWVYLMPEDGRFPNTSLLESGVFEITDEEREWLDGSQLQTAV